ncbi:putative rRNA maturation factor [Sphingomonas zeicaulis]|uniref:rRNA maturation RNase YbeY n=1 Tax=Sphingomonas zeicaulis TaxID=1632740 RepID=UPI003D1A0D08
MLDIALLQDADWPDTTDWDTLATQAVTAAVTQTPHGFLASASFAVEVSVKLAGNEEVRALNAAYRDKDRPTNVLSFPMVQPDLIESLTNSDDGEVLLGDIVLAQGVCEAEAEERGITLEAHATHLIVHGTLHLLGYDHQGTDEAEAMEALERTALAGLGIADPYPVDEG